MPLRQPHTPYMIAAGMPGAYARVRRSLRSPGYRVVYEGQNIVSGAERERGEMDALDRHWSELMAKAQSGDQAAYAELLREILPILRAVARRQHRNFERAEDVVQDVLLTIHRVRHTFDPKRSFRGWVFTIARRRSIDVLRKTGRLSKHEECAEQSVIEGAVSPTPEENPFEDLEPGLARAVASLPPGQRQAIELVKLRELSLAEAAAHSGVSAGALKVAVHRAMKTLRERLAGT
jgi:RNA polymerase sigma-70 factor (ECF subfamily)